MEHEPGGGLDERWAVETHTQTRTHTHPYNDTDTRARIMHTIQNCVFNLHSWNARAHGRAHTNTVSDHDWTFRQGR